MHEAVEFWERRGRADPLDTQLDWYEQAWERLVSEMLEREPDVDRWLVAGNVKSATDLANRHVRGREQVQAYRDFALTSDRWKVLELVPDEYAVEVPFDIHFGPVRVTGFVDQVIEWDDGRIGVRDLKTGTKKPATPLQLGVYRWAVHEAIGVLPDWGDYYMAKDADLSTPHNLSIFTREFVEARFVDMDRAERQGIYLVNPGDHCRVCGVSDFCQLRGARAAEYAPRRENAA